MPPNIRQKTRSRAGEFAWKIRVLCGIQLIKTLKTPRDEDGRVKITNSVLEFSGEVFNLIILEFMEQMPFPVSTYSEKKRYLKYLIGVFLLIKN